MQRILIITLMMMAIVQATACSSARRHHDTAMPDPASYNAHFGDLDADGDEWVSEAEFKSHFPDAETKVFDTIDMNQDGSIDHDEWHQFKEAHGMKHHE